jgi:hypothetical protein
MEITAHHVQLFLSGIMRLDARARQDVAILEAQFLKLDGKLLLFCPVSLAF